MPSLHFLAKPHPISCKIRLRYTYNRDSRCDFYCGVEISDVENFNVGNDLMPISKKESDYEIKNTQLKLLKRNVEEVIQSLILLKKEPTAKLVKERYKTHKFVLSNNTEVESKINRYFVLQTLDEYVKHLRSRVSMGDGMKMSSFEKSRRIIEKWKDFLTIKKMASIQFEELRTKYTLLRDFAEWVIKEEKFANSSVNKYNMVFRGFMRWSAKMDYHNIDEKRFDSPNLKEVSNRSILALTPKQLLAIHSFTGFDYLDKDGNINEGCLQYKKKEERYFYYEDRFVHKQWGKDGNLTETKFVKTYTTLEVVKDFFCFLCSTSLSYIDAANLKIKDVDIDKDLIEIIRAKTSTPISIPLNETSRAIWRKYSKDKNFKRKDGHKIDTHFLFPRFEGSDKFLSNANTNSTLKKIGEVLQKDLSNMVNVEVRSGSGVKKGTDEEVPLYKKLHTHMGRKTFITFALSEKISPLDIKRISGHSDEKMMKYYVNSLRDEVVEQFQNMDVFMGKGEYVGPKNKKNTAKKVEIAINKTVKEALTELKELLDGGLIEKDEFDKMRIDILKRV
jgi:integrase